MRIMLCECMVLQGPTVPRLLVSTLFWWENWIEKKYRYAICEMNVTHKDYENFGAEEGDCLLELVRLYELESDNPQVTWETVTKSFNETIGKV